MIEIDGSAGGGQLLRSAIALSAITDTPIRIEDVRGARENPGLKIQHATAVRAAAAVADATIDGADPGDRTVEFDPGQITGGHHSVEIGTAGSLTLLFETILPMASVAEAPIRLRAAGGTDVAWSPPFAYLRRVKLPLLRRFGFGAAVDLKRRGFYPKGGGAATLSIFPSEIEPIGLAGAAATADVRGARVYAIAEESLADAEVAERMAATATDALSENGHDVGERVIEYTSTKNPGAVITIRGDLPATVPGPNGDVSGIRPAVGASALGEPGTPSEEVASEAVDRFDRFVDSFGAVDRYLADQLVVPLAIAGGEVAIPTVTDHVTSSIELLEPFGLTVSREDRADGGTILRSPGMEIT
ncbi:RNA 3'-terminal phosphate cyclase [Halopenitus sp. H-Gu1]|uniref:RNA 3'-terminal phosphate cyclase n=1 Tax=Halopenitus sp. H-Gu1 TaxID=3242697 RepID=UPI00359D55CF